MSLLELHKLLEIQELQDKLDFFHDKKKSYLQQTQLEELKDEVQCIAHDFMSKFTAILEKYNIISASAIKMSSDSVLNIKEEGLPPQQDINANSTNAVSPNAASPSLSKKQPFILQKNLESTFTPADARAPVTDIQEELSSVENTPKSNTPPSVSHEKSESLENISAPPATERKKSGGFGIKSMLSSLTKGRPKPKRAESVPQKNAPGLDSAESGSSKDVVEVEVVADSKANFQDLPIKNEQEDEILPTQLSLDEADSAIIPALTEEPVPVKKYVPTNAMSALASAMRAGLSGSESNLGKSSTPPSLLAGQEIGENNSSSPPPIPTSRPSIVQQSIRAEESVPGTPPPVAVKPRPRRSSSVNENNQPVTQPPRPYTYHEGDSSLASVAASSVLQSSPPPVLPRVSQTRSNGPPTLPRAQSRPTSSHFPESDSLSMSSSNPPASVNTEANSPAASIAQVLPSPGTVGGVPILPLGSASRPSTPVSESSPVRSESDKLMVDVEPVRTKEEEARYQLALKAQRSSPLKPTNKPKMAPGPALSFKKKENSTSGDDKALEKKALEWLNSKLSSREGFEPITDLFSCFADGVTLIYALEIASGQSVGKYSKKAILQVHKLDNTTVALAFLSKLGADTHEYSPQTLLDGHKGKILSLFNVILKLFPN